MGGTANLLLGALALSMSAVSDRFVLPHRLQAVLRR